MKALRCFLAIALLGLAGVAGAADPPKSTEKGGSSSGKPWKTAPGESWKGGEGYKESKHKWEAPPRPPAPFRTQLSTKQRGHIETLLGQKHRPTIQELTATLTAAYGGMPKENPFGSGSRIRGQARDIANMIAQLELAYPGGTYLPLGRDAVLIADILEAYYRSIGQPDRIKRLNASGTSFPHYRDANERTYEEDRPIITGFLKSNGLDFDKVSKDRPYVMVDVTPYSSTSQSRQLMRSAFRSWAKMGRDPKELADKVAFVGIPMGMARHRISDAVAGNIDEMKAKVKASTTSDGPSDILFLGGSNHGLTYTSSWHGMFERFIPDGKGGVTTEPGHPSGEGSRLDVLGELYDIVGLVSSPTFHATVKDVAAKEYGYEFPAKRSSTLTKTAVQPVKSVPKEPDWGRGSWSGGGSPSLSSATSTFVAAAKLQLKRTPTAEKANEFIEDLAGMFGRNTFTKYDVREAVRKIGKYVDLTDAKIQAKVADLEKKYPGFAKQFGKGAEGVPAPTAKPEPPSRSFEPYEGYDW